MEFNAACICHKRHQRLFFAANVDGGMMRKLMALVVFLVLAAGRGYAQTDNGKGVWEALSSPTMDPAKAAVTERVDINRDRIHITLMSGSIQFVKPVNGIVFGAIFHGEG